MAESPNLAAAITGLRYWWSASGRSAISVTNFDLALAYYKSKPGFIDRFGALVKSVSDSKVRTAMLKVAKANGTNLPLYSEFLFAIGDEVGTLSASQVAAAAGSGVVDAAKFAGTTALDLGKTSLLLYVGIAAIGVYVLPKLLTHFGRK